MAELGEHFEYTCRLLADRLVTPARFGGALALAEVIQLADYRQEAIPGIDGGDTSPDAA